MSTVFKIKKYTRMFAAFLLFSGCVAHQQITPVKTIFERADSLIAITPDFSGVILLAEKGIPVYHKAFGYYSVESHKLLDTSAIFELASLSKPFTAIVIMMLKEGGKLNYDDPIEKYLPGLPYAGISIRNLLNHTSGLPDYMDVMDKHWDKTKVAGNENIIAYLQKYHPPELFEPGEKFAYSNTGYVLLASIAERVSGKNFIAFCRQHIFSQLAMNSTDIRSQQEKIGKSGFTSGSVWEVEKGRYSPADSFPSSNYNIWLGARKGPGRISSTSLDLLKWDRALYSNQLVSQSTLAEAFTPAKLKNDSLSAYGFGWMLRTNSPYGKVIYHTGDNPGYLNEMVRYIDQDKTLIILCNNAHPKFEAIVEGLEQLFADKTKTQL